VRDHIAEWRVRCLVPADSPWAAAQSGAIERALSAGIADALANRLRIAAGDGEAVIIIRTVEADASLTPADLMLDRRVVERVCDGAVAAVEQLCSGDHSEEEIVRFTDEAEYVGSFILDLLAGVAWDLWYFGPFRRYRRDSSEATLRAMFASGEFDAQKVRDWLARSGESGPVEAVLRAADACRLIEPAVGSEDRESNALGMPVLIDAAARLLEALGLGRPAVEVESPPIVGRQRQVGTVPPWTDRRALSQWVLAWLRCYSQFSSASRSAWPAGAAERTRALLAGALDWLDGPWLLEQLGVPVPEPVARAGNEPVVSRRPLTPGHSELLTGLATRLARGQLRVPASVDARALARWLVEAVADPSSRDDARDGVLASTLERIAEAAVRWAGSRRAGYSLERSRPDPRRSEGPLARASLPADVPPGLPAGPAADQLLVAVVASMRVGIERGLPTAGGGLYLMTRAIEDVRLLSLAGAAGVETVALRAALAAKWLELAAPFDECAAVWIGGAEPRLADLEGAAESLEVLVQSLAERLSTHGTVDRDSWRPDLEAEMSALPALHGLPATVDRLLAEVAALTMRAWARWLPGLGHAGTRFLAERCLRRAAEARVTDLSVDLVLAPAPLDVVVEMAGYLAPIERVSWLGNRAIRFSVHRLPTSPAP